MPKGTRETELTLTLPIFLSPSCPVDPGRGKTENRPLRLGTGGVFLSLEQFRCIGT